MRKKKEVHWCREQSASGCRLDSIKECAASTAPAHCSLLSITEAKSCQSKLVRLLGQVVVNCGGLPMSNALKWSDALLLKQQVIGPVTKNTTMYIMERDQCDLHTQLQRSRWINADPPGIFHSIHKDEVGATLSTSGTWLMSNLGLWYYCITSPDWN